MHADVMHPPLLVSILSRPVGRELPDSKRGREALLRFQSSPDP